MFQLNTFKGKLLDEIIEYVRVEDFDILNFQEVAGGKFSLSGQDNIEDIKKALGYQAEKNLSINPTSDPETYFGLATFFKNVKFLGSEVIWLKPFEKDSMPEIHQLSEVVFNLPRASLSSLFEYEGKKFYCINAHLNRGETSEDTDYKLMQAQILINYIKELQHPFVLTGDFNVDQTTKVIKNFGQLGKNLTVEKGIPYTLNPNLHAIKDDPKIYRLAVDYIFVSEGIKVKNFDLVTKDLSDHYGLKLEFEVV